MTTLIRGSNPIWSEFDLTGNIFDDTYFLFVLENDLPYLPATVYHDPDGNVPWTNPIQFLANGTLPVDIFFTPSIEYRLEFRKGNTQSDPLIYLVENYVAGAGGSTPVTTVGIFTDNQITNPQFSLVSFSSPFSLLNVTNPDPIEVAPGWFLNLTGTGNVTLEQVPLNDTLPTDSNSPYALRITLSGTWSTGADSPVLSQRFNQNGMLWAGKYVSSSITTRLEGAPQSIEAQLVDSNGTILTNVLSPTNITSTFAQYNSYGLVPATTNPDTPPAAWVEYRLILPTTIDIYVSSFQLIASALPIAYEYEQDTIERQVDHTFHYYRDSLLFQPKNTLLTGFNCSLNPWQARSTASATLASQCAYTADQIIIYQQAGASKVAIGQGSLGDNYPLEIKAVVAANQFAAIEYIDPATIRPYWGQNLSAMLRAKLTTTNASVIQVKMRLIYRASLPSTLGAAEPIASWVSGADPVFAAGWTALVPENDPVYTLSANYQSLSFNAFTLPASTNADMTLGIVIYTITDMIETGTADTLQIERCSLVPNDFAIDVNTLTFDENLRRCQYYYSKSFAIGTPPATIAGTANATFSIQGVGPATGPSSGPAITFPVIMRISPTITLYNPQANNAQIRDSGSGTDWSATAVSAQGTRGFLTSGTTPGVSAAGNTTCIHWSANARMGQ